MKTKKKDNYLEAQLYSQDLKLFKTVVRKMTNREVLCGLGAWRPGFLQPLASKKVYMFLYGCLGIIQGMFFTYLSATLSTMERQFGIKSKEAAYLMSGNEFSQILFVFAMPFIVKVKKRPFWTAMGLGKKAEKESPFNPS